MHVRNGDENGDYNSIKLFHFANGLLLVGMVKRFHTSHVNVISPAVLSVEIDTEQQVIGYEFNPYLSPLLPFDPLMQSIAINLLTVISTTDPSEHVIRNYAAYMKLHHDEAEANERGKTALDEPLDSPAVNQQPTFH